MTQPPTQDRSFEEARDKAAKLNLISAVSNEGGFFSEAEIENYLRYRGFKEGANWSRTFTQAEERKRAAEAEPDETPMTPEESAEFDKQLKEAFETPEAKAALNEYVEYRKRKQLESKVVANYPKLVAALESIAQIHQLSSFRHPHFDSVRDKAQEALAQIEKE